METIKKLMISILIPTYNYNVFPLAKSLEKQFIELGFPFELICIDDGSLSETNIKNEKINNLKNCKFIASKANLGLSSNRNSLVEKSKYEYLLFIDGDSVIADNNFLNKYSIFANGAFDVVYGGRVHPSIQNKNQILRWKYGVYREDKIARKREIHPYKCTLFNNTLIKKDIFNKIGFNKDITDYGHEDTLFSFQLSKLKAKVKHIDNPVLHGDIDLNSVFYKKMHKSIQNLKYIYNNNLVDPDFVTFLSIYSKIKKLKLNYPLSLTYKILKPIYNYQLTSNYASLFLFDAFRLTYFCYINLKK
ncbi:glycosyltransferase [Tamlana crocina]